MHIVVSMLQHRLLIQLHTYVFFVPMVKRRTQKLSDENVRVSIIQEEWGLLDGGFQSEPSFSDAASGTLVLLFIGSNQFTIL